MTPEEARAELERAVTRLAEHFEVIRVFALRPADEPGTVNAHTHGCGNWYAQYGMVREWLLESEERLRRQQQESDGD